MSRRKRSRAHHVKAEMNVVPYIDVMLVLLVIFMIAAPLIHQAIEIELPEAQATELEMPEGADSDTLPLVLTVDRSGQFFLNWAPDPTTPLGSEQIVQITRYALTQHPALPVLVQGDRGVPYASVIEGIGYLQEAGAPNVGLSTEPPQAQAATTLEGPSP